MIPDNKKTEQQLAKSNEKIQIIINNILDIIVEIDLNGSFIYVSPQSVQMLGYEPNEVIGKKALKFIHPNDLKTVMDAIRDAIINNKHVRFEYRAKHKNGNYVSVSARGGVIKTIPLLNQ
jgi:two-component system sporulation sensor kinase A